MSDVLIDLYPFLNLKSGEDLLGRIAVSFSWVPKEHRRRLKAYTVLAAYAANVSNLVRKSPNTEDGKLREYGDANFICTTMSAAVTGDSVRIFAPSDAKKQEEFFKNWAEKEMFFSKLCANEYKASNLGDCVYKLAWSKDKGRTKVYTIDPGFWFPFNIGESNERHIIAWEQDDGKNGTEIYKEEYRLEKNSGSGAKGGGTTHTVRLTAGYYKKSTKESLEDLRLIRYAKDDQGNELNNIDLAIDTIPIVYIPNIYREGFDFGESDLTAVYRILDDLSNVYTDEQQNTYFMGLVPLWMNHEAYELLPVDKDGKRILKMGDNNVLPGEAGIVDNSTINKALFETQHELESKLFKNTFLGVLGSGTEQSSSGDRTTGIFQLKGSILERFVNLKRLTREAKYNLLLRIVAKFESTLGANKEVFKDGVDARIQFGNILPINQKALMENVERVKDRLSKSDLKDNVREAGLTVNEEMSEPAKQAPAKPTIS